MNRYQVAQQRAESVGRGMLHVYVPLGFPDLAASEERCIQAIEAGVDGVELGLPFSDPAADGPTIEAATQRALQGGTTVADCLAVATRLRTRFPDIPLTAMTYANLAYRPGWRDFAMQLRDAGIDGLILPDAPMEESTPIREALAEAGILWVPLVAPTTPAARMDAIAATATGFLYVVGSVGITGGADPGKDMEATVARARQVGAEVPLMVGFGISSAQDVARVVAAGADGAIVGSHLVRHAEDPDGYGDEVQALLAGR